MSEGGIGTPDRGGVHPNAAETAAHAIRNLTTMLIAAMLLLYALTKDETLLEEIVEAIRANEEEPLAAA